ncbi:MAG TPA: hypothetical protein VMV75_09345 [Sulfuricella sp.]|nr:hypothetical protein [Sulfuricella sp.]
MRTATPRSVLMLLLVTASLLAGCAAINQPVVGSTSADQKAGTAPPNALPISDIPIPAGARLDTENSLIMGAQDRWLGRIVIKTDASPTETYNYFNNGMPTFGWTVVTAVQARISALIFMRGDRVASIQIEPTTLNGSTVSITISPRQAGPEPVRQK